MCAVPGPSLLFPNCPVFLWLRRVGGSVCEGCPCTVYRTRDELKEFKREPQTVNSRPPSLLCSYPNVLKVHFKPPRIARLEARARKPTRWALLNASRLSFLPQTFLFHLIHQPACSLLREALNGSQCNLGFS